MGSKKEALILKALDERKRFDGRHLLPDSHDAAAALVAFLHARAPEAVIEAVGSLRRGCDTCGDLDLLASGAPASLMDEFVAIRQVERVLGHGDTKSSILIRGGFQADLRLVAADSRGAALQYFTGSKPHNIALRDRAIGLGYKLNEYGVFRITDDTKVAGEREEDIYAALGLEWVAPELRELARRDRGGRVEHPAAPHRSRRSARRSAHAHHRKRREGRAARDGGRGARCGPRVHRDHRPQSVARHGQRASTSDGRWPTPPASALSTPRGSGYGSSPGSNATSAPTGRWIWRTTAWLRSTSSSPRYIPGSIRTARR
jgi:DNA polymerase (family 10)